MLKIHPKLTRFARAGNLKKHKEYIIKSYITMGLPMLVRFMNVPVYITCKFLAKNFLIFTSFRVFPSEENGI